MYIHVYTCKYMYIHVYTCTYICTHVCTCIYTHLVGALGRVFLILRKTSFPSDFPRTPWAKGESKMTLYYAAILLLFLSWQLQSQSQKRPRANVASKPIQHLKAARAAMCFTLRLRCRHRLLESAETACWRTRRGGVASGLSGRPAAGTSTRCSKPRPQRPRLFWRPCPRTCVPTICATTAGALRCGKTRGSAHRSTALRWQLRPSQAACRRCRCNQHRGTAL